MNKIFIFLLCAALVVFNSCTNDEKTVFDLDSDLEEIIKSRSFTGELDFYKMPQSYDYANLPNQDPKNPVTAEKAALGKFLFFETGIGMSAKKSESMATYSCSSCHIPEIGFTAGRFQGIADGGIGFGSHGEGRTINPNYSGNEVDAQGARPLPVINLAYVRNPLWNGAFGSFGMNIGTEDVWGVGDSLTIINKESREGLEAVVTRALVVHRQVINKELMDKLGYTPLFDKAFPNEPVETRYTLQMASHAISAYFRTILTNQAPFQKWLKGEQNALTGNQKRGAILFFGKAGCVSCHNSPSFNGQQFAAVGVKDLDQNGYLVYKTNDGRSKGRAGFTLKDSDLYKFKVPELYNLKDAGFYFHGASKRSLKEVVQYFNAGIPENPNVTPGQVDFRFKPLNLTDEEVEHLTSFLEYGLYDPNLTRYKPDLIFSGNCFPNNDAMSQQQMGCK
jgi:cytochrome c peroxidase